MASTSTQLRRLPRWPSLTDSPPPCAQVRASTEDEERFRAFYVFCYKVGLGGLGWAL